MTACHTYPYTMVDGHLILDCEGRKLLLDTGAPTSVSADPTLPFAGIEHPSAADYLGVSLQDVGGLVGTHLDGLIGADALTSYDTVIDPVLGEVRVYEGEYEASGTSLDLDCSMLVPIIEVTIAGNPVKMIFDTGAKISYVDRQIAEPFPPRGEIEDFFPGLGTFTTETFDVPISLGNQLITIRTGALSAIPAMALTLVGAQGIIGSALLDHLVVGFSPRRRVMTLAKLQ